MAVDRRTVEVQLRALGDFHQWGTKKEVRHLPAVLNSGETIRAVISGVYQGNTWVVTVTDQPAAGAVVLRADWRIRATNCEGGEAWQPSQSDQ